MKRIFDFLIAGVGIFLLAPVFLILSLAVWVGSGPPILFHQKRVGLEGRDFRLVKFRTMTVMPGTEQGSFEAGRAMRVTPIGRWLRRTKLDELPQLWNVLRGDMSLVGPRPEVRKWVEAYPNRWALIHKVKPGITDPASIFYRNEEDILSKSNDPDEAYRLLILPNKLTFYEEYVRTRTFVGDIGLIIKTVFTVLRKGND